MRCQINVGILVVLLTGGGLTTLFAAGERPATEAIAAEIEQLALKSTKGGCPGGQGFCCLLHQRKLQSALEETKGVSQVIPDKKSRTFSIVYPKGGVTLADLKQAAQQAGFEVTEARRLV